ncbi:MAG: M20 family metallopeptidase [Alphaproteobacteria bacterium]|nr:M20 family metallopeptidase [Alphaproteobacteria bacterium]
MSTRSQALAAAGDYVESGRFDHEFAAAVACPTCSPESDPSRKQFQRYFDTVVGPQLDSMGFERRLYDNPEAGRHAGAGLFLVATRIEAAAARTVLIYGHIDTVAGMDAAWDAGLQPFELTRRGDRYYGRGTADNKLQHWANIKALRFTLETKGRLGFNVKILLETGEETGSPGLRRFCEENAALLAADVFIASDGPRLAPDRPTLFLGARGAINFELIAEFRDGAHHSGNWGGLLKDPGVRLTHALASLTDARGRLEVPEWRPRNSLTDAVRRMLAGCEPLEDAQASASGEPAIDPDWGEPSLSPAERVFGWNSFAVLALELGDPATPANAIAGRARAVCQLRTVVGTDADDVVPAVRRHLDAMGFSDIQVVTNPTMTAMAATRVDPNSPWVDWARRSIAETTGQEPAILPNLGGSLPNDCFADVLGLPTIWVPHSYRGCNQHAPNEHILAPLAEEGMRMMTGLYWDLEQGPDFSAMSQQSRAAAG